MLVSSMSRQHKTYRVYTTEQMEKARTKASHLLTSGSHIALHAESSIESTSSPTGSIGTLLNKL